MLPIYLTIQCFHLWDLDARGFHRVGLKTLAYTTNHSTLMHSCRDSGVSG